MLSTDMSFSLARKLALLPLKRSLSIPSLRALPSSAVIGSIWTCVKIAWRRTDFKVLNSVYIEKHFENEPKYNHRVVKRVQ